jgi:hypothetical protein
MPRLNRGTSKSTGPGNEEKTNPWQTVKPEMAELRHGLQQLPANRFFNGFSLTSLQ